MNGVTRWELSQPGIQWNYSGGEKNDTIEINEIPSEYKPSRDYKPKKDA